MAIPGLGVSPKQKQRLKKEDYSALGPRFDNRLQLRRAASRAAYGQIKPKLSDLTQEGMAERQASKGRMRDLASMYSWYGNQTQAAYDETTKALNDLIASSAAGNTQNQANLQAALASATGAAQDQANIIGGVLPRGQDAAVEQAAAAMGGKNLTDLTRGVAPQIGIAGGRIAGVGLGRTRAMESEQGRDRALMQRLRKQKTEVKSTAPAVREEEERKLEEGELAKQTEKNREKIAKGSLHLEGRKATEEERSNRAQEGIAWAGIRAEKEKFAREVELAEGEGGKKKAEAQQARYNSGVNIFQSYFEHTKPKAQNPKTLYRNLTLAVPPDMALKIMLHGPPEFQQFARKKMGGGGRGGRGEGKPGDPVGANGPVGVG